jgi:hypothetical protein
MKLAQPGDMNNLASTTPSADGLNINIIITFNPLRGCVSEGVIIPQLRFAHWGLFTLNPFRVLAGN